VLSGQGYTQATTKTIATIVPADFGQAPPLSSPCFHFFSVRNDIVFAYFATKKKTNINQRHRSITQSNTKLIVFTSNAAMVLIKNYLTIVKTNSYSKKKHGYVHKINMALFFST
jgi:hypothetical protein